MIPRMTSDALNALFKAIDTGDYSTGWTKECTNHPYHLKGTKDFHLIADGHGDFEAEVFFGQTSKGSSINVYVPIERIDLGYENQKISEGYCRLVSPKHSTWSWAWGGITVLLDDTKTKDLYCADEESDCECAPIYQPIFETKPDQRSLEEWF